MTEQNETASVKAHYTSNDLTATILKALKAAGKNPEALSSDDLITFDQLHVGGKDATLQLAHLAGIEQAMSVLDVGGGLGGPARILASTFKCHVTVSLQPCSSTARLTSSP